MLSSPAISFSIGTVTLCSTSSAATPGYGTVMNTKKKGISENCSRGRRSTLTTPITNTKTITMLIRTGFLTENEPIVMTDRSNNRPPWR